MNILRSMVLVVIALGVGACAGTASSASPSVPDSSFMASCTSAAGGSETGPFCDCTWRFLRQEGTFDGMSAVEAKALVERVGPRLTAACADALPEASFEVATVKACVAGSQSLSKAACTCSYRQLRKSLSKAELLNPAMLKTERFAVALTESRRACAQQQPGDEACASTK
jgi:hypothetical protein